MTYRWITLDNGRSVYRRDPLERGPASDLPAPMLIRDQMDDLRHPATGKHYSSKSDFRRATRQSGALEVGSDTIGAKPTLDQVSSADVGEAIRKVKAGYKPVLADGGTVGWGEPTNG